MLPWLLCAALAAAVLILCLRLWLLHRAMDELRAQLPDLMGEDTNVLLGISSRDKHARALAAALNRELRELRRLRWKYMSGDRELKEAVTNISHDLRTPLTAICGYLELLEREDKSEAAESISSTSASGRSDAAADGGLFCYSVILAPESAPEQERGDLRAVLEKSLAGAYPKLMERGIAPEVDMPDAPVYCMMNEAAASRVFGNVLSNAVKYSSGDLAVRLTADGEAEFANTAPGLDDAGGAALRALLHRGGRPRSTGLGLPFERSWNRWRYCFVRLSGGKLVLRLSFRRA
ncbi:MAG: sensor histidine kinase [Oscillospiraceae bacterium]